MGSPISSFSTHIILGYRTQQTPLGRSVQRSNQEVFSSSVWLRRDTRHEWTFQATLCLWCFLWAKIWLHRCVVLLHHNFISCRCETRFKSISGLDDTDKKENAWLATRFVCLMLRVLGWGSIFLYWDLWLWLHLPRFLLIKVLSLQWLPNLCVMQCFDRVDGVQPTYRPIRFLNFIFVFIYSKTWEFRFRGSCDYHAVQQHNRHWQARHRGIQV